MIKAFVSRRIGAFEKRWDYNCGYLRTVADASTGAVLKLALVQPAMSHREGVPPDAWSAAQLTATLAADCGSCVDLARKSAREMGMSEENIQLILNGRVELMEDETLIGYSFAQAVTERDEEEVATLRCEVLRRWGSRALVSLSMVTATAGLFPTLKFAIGPHGLVPASPKT